MFSYKFIFGLTLAALLGYSGVFLGLEVFGNGRVKAEMHDVFLFLIYFSISSMYCIAIYWKEINITKMGFPKYVHFFVFAISILSLVIFYFRFSDVYSTRLLSSCFVISFCLLVFSALSGLRVLTKDS